MAGYGEEDGAEDDDGVVSSNLKFVRGDIRAVDLVEHVLVTENVDTVMHFAARFTGAAYQLEGEGESVVLTCTPKT